MSAAKMVADSTQSDLTCDQRGDQAGASREPGEDKSDKNHTSKMKRRKNVDGKKNKKTKKSWKKGTKKKNESTLADENNPDLDLDKVLKEIGDFIKNRQEMVDEMFHAVRGASLDRALPEALKSVAMEDLKRRCVEHLEVMSRKRIFRIMADTASKGTEKTQSQAADSTSQTGGCQSDLDDMVVQDEADRGNEDSGRTNAVVPEEAGGPWSGRSSSAGSEEGERRSPRSESHTNVILAMEEGESEGELVDSGQEVDNQGEGQDSNEDRQEGSVDEEWSSEDEEMVMDLGGEPGVHRGQKSSTSVSDSLIPVLTKNQMELLELEMRAKAIKAMLSKMKK
ncbi:caspase activity and apoptosis inhibitor 1-like isoform X2 [Gigantopelta aegis]|uniref:caspase activity and apoptosis inhibitor 1-like isoform X2 n=1 Tax=Gigantopelta aegis TaxID=1735272 RepID=UPI001B88C486|nr:caspase activity and apoptosis inhibitor 1-like isoform X2 [Gigantopelta aegis]